MGSFMGENNTAYRDLKFTVSYGFAKKVWQTY